MKSASDMMQDHLRAQRYCAEQQTQLRTKIDDLEQQKLIEKKQQEERYNAEFGPSMSPEESAKWEKERLERDRKSAREYLISLWTVRIGWIVFLMLIIAIVCIWVFY